MRPYLLDVNLLLAMSDPLHVHHDAAHRWFATTGKNAWATCPTTENAFVRIASNPRYPNRPGDVRTALTILGKFCSLDGHHFWPEDVSLSELLQPEAIVSHKQVTDVYLLGLAASKGGKLATLDRHIPTSAVIGGAGALVLIPA